MTLHAPSYSQTSYSYRMAEASSDNAASPSSAPPASGEAESPAAKSLVVSKAASPPQTPAERAAAARLKREALLSQFLEVAVPLVAETQNIATHLSDPYYHTHAEALSRTLRTLIRMAKDIELYRFARVARGMQLYAQSLSNGTIALQPADWKFMAETHVLMERMLEKLRRFKDEGACEQETAEAKCWLLTHRPEIARLAVRLSD